MPEHIAHAKLNDEGVSVCDECDKPLVGNSLHWHLGEKGTHWNAELQQFVQNLRDEGLIDV